MKKIHWSKTFAEFITLEVPYDDGARQGWDYDCIQYQSYESLKNNMTSDFVDPRMDRSTAMVHVIKGGQSFSAEIEIDDKTGEEFTELIFKTIDELVLGEYEWQQAVIS